MSTPLARTTDPATSHAAGALAGKGLREIVAAKMAWHLQLTDEQLVAEVRAAYPYYSESGVRTRRKELVAEGLVKSSGRTTKSRRGREMTVWQWAGA